MAPDSRTYLGGVGDEGRTVGHVNDTAPIEKRRGEDGLLSCGKADRVVKIVADLPKSSEAHSLGALERIGANRIFPAEANETSSHKSGTFFGMPVLNA